MAALAFAALADSVADSAYNCEVSADANEFCADARAEFSDSRAATSDAAAADSEALALFAEAKDAAALNAALDSDIPACSAYALALSCAVSALS